MGIIETRDLTKRYGKRRGVASIDLDIAEGACFGFLGPNGAGKTTAIRLLLGFLRPTAGRAAILGRDCWRESHLIKREVGYVPGDLRLYGWMRGHSAASIVGKIHGRDLTASFRRLAERYRFDPEVPVHKMSKGMRQKLGLLLALAPQPRLLIMDEPTAGLDPLMQDELKSHLRELAGKGHTIFFSSHTLSEVEQLCDRIAIVRDGSIVADETMEVLRGRARRTVTVLFREGEAGAADLDPPPGLELIERSGRRWEGELSGSVAPLIEWAAGREIEDLVIGKPDLESLFRGFYRRRDEAAR